MTTGSLYNESVFVVVYYMLHVFITVIYSVIYNKYDFDVFNGQDPLPKYYYRNMQMYHILFIY